MIIQIRGTSGSGKTHLVKQVLTHYSQREDHFTTGRRRPLYTTWAGKAPRRLTTLGHYDIPCGGADTISGFDTIFGLVNQAEDRGEDVLFEGLILTGDNKRIIACAKAHSNHLIVSLNTPLEVCLAQINARRAARGNNTPVSPVNTQKKWGEETRHRAKMISAGVNIQVLTPAEALFKIIEALQCV